MKSLFAIVLLSLACASAPPPQPRHSGTLLLPPATGLSQRLIDAKDPRYKPEVRPQYRKADGYYYAMFKVCVTTTGRVDYVGKMKGTGVSDIDDDWTKTIESWPHRPYRVDGQVHPFCYPLRLASNDASAADEDDGVEGGVEGGVAGGTANNATLLPPNVGAAQILTDPHDPKYSPKVRPEYVRPGSAYWALLKVCVTAAGEVHSVSFLRSTGISELDADWTKTVASWSYRSYTINDKPVPFCYPMRLEVRMAPKRKG